MKRASSPYSGRPSFEVVVHEVADDLHPGGIDGSADPAAQHIEVAFNAGARLDVRARLDGGFAATLHGEAALDGGKNFLIRKCKAFDVRTAQVVNVNGRCVVHRGCGRGCSRVALRKGHREGNAAARLPVC